MYVLILKYIHKYRNVHFIGFVSVRILILVIVELIAVILFQMNFKKVRFVV